MLGLRDFVHLPEVEPYFERIIRAGPGLVAVAGLDPRPHATGVGVAPSGRATIFRILARQMIEARAGSASVVAGEKGLLHLPRRLGRQVSFQAMTPTEEWADFFAESHKRPPALLVLERLQAATIPAVYAAIARGATVLSQLDTVLRGAAVVQTLAQWGLAPAVPATVISIQRLPTLCPACKTALPPAPQTLAAVARRYPHLALPPDAAFYRAPGCARCGGEGRQGHVAAFDLYCAAEADSFPLERYLLHLALDGLLPLDDLLELEAAQLRRTYRLLDAGERALRESNDLLARRGAELESAYQLLQRQTQTLVSLQDLGQALIAGTDLGDLALRVCHHSCALSGADRAILYTFREGRAELLAAHGWDPARLPPAVSAAELALPPETAPVPFERWPPGVPPRDPLVAGFALSAGLALPLDVQGERVGLLLLHAERKEDFAPGERSLLQTFANQAALALQRAGLVGRLREKVAALEAAQVALAQKERLERELELARQVQESMLPRTFPAISGFTFAAHSRPARQVGGDFYDVISLDGGHFGVAIADVSDKGLPAALYMALTRSLLLAESDRSRSPAAVLARVNDLLLRLGEGEGEMFVTLFYGIVDVGARTLRYARAGHDRPFHFHGDACAELDAPGTALGILPTATLGLADRTVPLAPGDRLFLYSDGLTDVLSPAGALFDRHRLAARFRAHNALSLAACCTQTFADLDAFQASAAQHDDMTLLALEVVEECEVYI